MFDYFSLTFMIYAMLLGLFLSLGASLLSPFLVLNNKANIADGLSHIAFTGIIIGLLFSNQPFYIAIPFSIISAIFITLIGKNKYIKSDAAISVISLVAVAIGLVIISKSEGFNISIETLLVGAITTTTLTEVIIALILCLICLLFICMFYRLLLNITYDKTYLQLNKKQALTLEIGLSIMVAVFIVLGVKTVGMLLISGLIIFPALIAIQFTKSFKNTLIIGIVISAINVNISFFLAYNLDLPIGSTIILIYSILLLTALSSNFLRRMIYAHNKASTKNH